MRTGRLPPAPPLHPKVYDNTNTILLEVWEGTGRGGGALTASRLHTITRSPFRPIPRQDGAINKRGGKDASGSDPPADLIDRWGGGYNDFFFP